MLLDARCEPNVKTRRGLTKFVCVLAEVQILRLDLQGVGEGVNVLGKVFFRNTLPPSPRLIGGLNHVMFFGCYMSPLKRHLSILHPSPLNYVSPSTHTSPLNYVILPLLTHL